MCDQLEIERRTVTIQLRDQTSQDTAAYPYVFICPEKGCYYAVSAKTHVDAEVQQFKHGRGNNVCPMAGPKYVNGKRIS